MSAIELKKRIIELRKQSKYFRERVMFGVAAVKGATEIRELDLQIGDKDEIAESSARLERREAQLARDREALDQVANEIAALEGGAR